MFFGSKTHTLQATKLAERDIRELASKKGEGTVELFNLASADREQLKQFSYLIDPQDQVFFIDNEGSEEVLESYLDSLEESIDPEKILAVLSLSGQSEVPLQFVQAIHHLYQEPQPLRDSPHTNLQNSASIGAVHYQPNLPAYSLFGFGNIKKEELETYHDIPTSFAEAETFVQNFDTENFAAEIFKPKDFLLSED